MRHLVTHIEQLDRAAEELHEGSDSGNRISLILTDNVVELCLHRFCESRVRWHRWAQPEKYTRAAMFRVLGPHLDEKLRFAKAEGCLSEHEFNFVRLCHAYRNEAYHVGLTRENIMFRLAWEYHALACKLLVRLDTGSLVMRPNTELPERFARHTPPEIGSSLKALPPKIEDLAKSVAKRRPPEKGPLAETLADSLCARVDEVERLLEYIVSGRPNKTTIEQELYDLQYVSELFGNVPPDIEIPSTEYNQYILAKTADMKANWTPKYRSMPFKSWRSRLNKLRQNSNPLLALDTYDRLASEVAALEKPVEETALALDDYINGLIDAARLERDDK